MTETELNYVSWMVIGGLCLAPIGAAFGAAAGVLARRQGHMPGSSWASALADRLACLRRKDFSPVGRGAVVGAVDGFLFLAFLGSAIGLIAGTNGTVPAPQLLLAATEGIALLAATALLLGIVAHALIHGTKGRSVVFFTGGVGALIGFCLAGSGGAGYGLLAGSVVGWIGTAGPRESKRPDAGEPHE